MQDDVVSNENLEKKKISFKWCAPKTVTLRISEKLLDGSFGRLFRTLLITIVIELAAYCFLFTLPLRQVGFNLERALFGLFLFAIAISIYSYLAGPYFIRYSRKRYEVSDKYILSNGKMASFKGLLGYSKIEMSSEYENVLVIFYYIKNSFFTRSLLFDINERELAEKVFSLLKKKLPDGEGYEEKARLTLSKMQHVVPLMVLSVWVCLVCMNFSFITSIGRMGMLVIMFSAFLFGPGTLGMLFLFGSKFFKSRDICMYAYAYNFVSFLVLLFVFLFCHVIEWSAMIRMYSR